MRRRVQHDLDQVTFFELGTLDAASTTTLRAELVGWSRLDIAAISQGED